MTNGYFNGIKIDQNALSDHIRYLKKQLAELTEIHNNVLRKYRTTTGWLDDGYVILGENLKTIDRKEVQPLLDTIRRTIKKLERLYQEIAKYLIIIKKNRR